MFLPCLARLPVAANMSPPFATSFTLCIIFDRLKPYTFPKNAELIRFCAFVYALPLRFVRVLSINFVINFSLDESSSDFGVSILVTVICLFIST